MASVPPREGHCLGSMKPRSSPRSARDGREHQVLDLVEGQPQGGPKQVDQGGLVRSHASVEEHRLYF